MLSKGATALGFCGDNHYSSSGKDVYGGEGRIEGHQVAEADTMEAGDKEGSRVTGILEAELMWSGNLGLIEVRETKKSQMVAGNQ
jgi:hypothetical protein